VHGANYGIYGARKVWLALNREGIAVARCTVERLMRAAGLAGAVRGKVKRTTISDPSAKHPGDLVERRFAPLAPDRLWVADFTYVSTWSGWVYVAFVIDAYARRIIGWRSSTSMTAELVLDALEHAVWTRTREGRDVTGVIAHHDHGSQYTSVAYSERLAADDIRPSMGVVGSSYDCEQNRGPLGRGLTRAYDWPRCLGVDLSTPAGRRSTHTPAGREGGDRIGA
jgi:putative transposase